MTSTYLSAFFYTFALLSGFFSRQAFSVEANRERLARPQPTAIGTHGQPPSMGSEATQKQRVRLKVNLLEYDRIDIKNELGVVRSEYRQVKNVSHTLRARLEVTNHFYVGSWHIESVPVSYNKETQTYAIGLRFSKKFGSDWDMEEYVGRVDVKGALSPKADNVFELIGHNSAKFFSPEGNPMLAVTIGKLDAAAISDASANKHKGEIATKADSTQPKSK